jgi:uncharacterized membrane protein
MIAALPIATVSIDTWLAEGFLSPFVFQFSTSSAQTILSTIAAGAMTALSLAYSLALLVFTLAAGNIGPRLLKRFTSELVPQVTAGILGGTFLYSLHALLYVQNEFLPKITIAVAGFLATLSVLQLIYFVRQIANNITIDEEIAGITNNLIEDLTEESSSLDTAKDDLPSDKEFEFEIKPEKSGYLNSYNRDAILKFAHKHDLAMKLTSYDGRFVSVDDVIVRMNKNIDDDLKSSLMDLISIENSRSNVNRIEFSIRLLVEIALRALSPGVNDTYTAIAVVDSLSKAILVVSDKEEEYSIQCDEDDIARLYSFHRSAKQIVGMSFHPLRRASTDNILMAQALAKVYSRLYENGTEKLQKIVKKHSLLLMEEVANGNHLETDIESVGEYLLPALKNN